MQIIASSDHITNRINFAWQQVLNNLPPQNLEDLIATPLIISDDNIANQVYSDEYNLFRRIYMGGFGAFKGNILYQNSRFHLVVLNMTMIDELDLDDRELVGVLSHELGHIFNKVPDRTMPSILNGFHKDLVDAAKAQYNLDNEFYADYFSKLTNSVTGLKLSMSKYISSKHCTNNEMFIKRLDKLEDHDALLGNVIAIIE